MLFCAIAQKRLKKEGVKKKGLTKKEKNAIFIKI